MILHSREHTKLTIYRQKTKYILNIYILLANSLSARDSSKFREGVTNGGHKKKVPPKSDTLTISWNPFEDSFTKSG